MKTLLITLTLVVAATTNPILELPNLGKIQGRVNKTLLGRDFFSFEGVPYAQPPIGEDRFKEPRPPQPWIGVLETQTIYACLQYNHFTPPGQDYVIGDEDCLYLNIYTPNLDPNANLDVVVYIHGGAFMFNSGGLQKPNYILDKDVVSITLNYRLGPLGFLSTEDTLLPGNNGMRDQILALEFVKKYVKYFGGNPNSVTIMGMSAGGASVHFHYLSPKSRNLFHRGISQSGCTLNPWVLMEKPLEKTKKLASIVGCPSEEIKVMVECLKSRKGRQIVGAVKHFQPWLYNPFSPFGLVVDSWASDPVLPQHPYELMTKKRVYDVPWVVSYTNSEGLYPAADFYKEEFIDDLETRWNELLPFILDYNYTVDAKLHDDVSEKIRKYYFGVSDRIFVIGLQKAARLQASATKSPVYSYYFTYRGAHSWSEYRSGSRDDLGASHGDDTAYVFKMDAVDTSSTQKDREMIDFLVDLVTSYAKNGRPNVPIEWPPVSDSFTYLQIDSAEKLSVGKGVLESTKFWESLPIIENEKLFSKSAKDEL